MLLADDEPTWTRYGHLFLVADGMGAHAAGELASKLACDGILHHYRKERELSAPESLQQAFRETNAEVHRRGNANAEFHNMGTTASMLALLPQGAFVSHVGDSRIYRVRGDHVCQITFDHSLVWELRHSGQMDKHAELAQAVPKNVITRSIGPNAAVQVDLEGPLPIEVGDTFMLCSDGLTGKVEDDELGPLLKVLPPGEAAQALIDLANLRGGPDNITVIVVRVTGEQLTTRAAGAEPITVGGKVESPGIHPGVLVAAGVCFLISLVMLVQEQYVPSLVALAGTVIASLVALFQRQRVRKTGISLTDGRRLGKGPYTTTDCTPNAASVERLSGIIGELRKAARSASWEVEWSQFDARCDQAESANADKKYDVALQEYARAISFMMQELRRQQNRQANDSVLE